MTHTKTTDWSELKRLAEAAKFFEPLQVDYHCQRTGLDDESLYAFLMHGDSDNGEFVCVDEEPTERDGPPSPRLEFIAALVNAWPKVLELIAEVERQEGVIKIMANHNVELIDEIDALTAQRDEMAEALGECLEAMEIVQSGNYGTCPVVSDPACRNDGPETPCPRCGDLGWFSDDPEYDPEKDGNCINDGASAILRKPISRARSSLNKEKTDG